MRIQMSVFKSVFSDNMTFLSFLNASSFPLYFENTTQEMLFFIDVNLIKFNMLQFPAVTARGQ